MSPTSFPTITPGEAWDTGPGQASTLMNQITGAVNALEAVVAPIPTPYLAPTGASYETFPRMMSQGGGLPLTSGTLYLTAIALPTGLSVGHLAWLSNRALSLPTHYWFTLHDSSRVMLAATADQTTTAWGLGVVKSLAVATIASGAASSFTTTYTGMHYLGIMVTATTTAQLDAVQFSALTAAVTPVLCGATSNTGQTTVPAFPFTAGALTSASGSFGYGYVGA